MIARSKKIDNSKIFSQNAREMMFAFCSNKLQKNDDFGRVFCRLYSFGIIYLFK